MGTLNIKSPEAYRLARELATTTGETLTAAVEQALRERLERHNARVKGGLRRWVDEVTPETAAIMNDGRSSKEAMDELYDPETGLPK